MGSIQGSTLVGAGYNLKISQCIWFICGEWIRVLLGQCTWFLYRECTWFLCGEWIRVLLGENTWFLHGECTWFLYEESMVSTWTVYMVSI